MKVKEITVSQTFNLGNYNSARLEMVVEVPNVECLDDKIDTAYKLALRRLEGIMQDYINKKNKENGK